MNSTFRCQEVLFARALALPAGERAVFLGQACGGNLALATGVAELLQAHEEVGGFLGTPAVLCARTGPNSRRRTS